MSNSLVTPWTAAHQAPLPMGFPRQEYWSELSFPLPGDLPDPVIKLTSPAPQVDSLPLSHQGSPFDTWHVVTYALNHLWIICAAAAKSLQSCPTLCNPIDGSPPGSPVPGILQARTLEWVAISFSSAWKWKVKVKSFSHVRLFTTLWTAAHQAPPSMGFSRQEYWSGVPLPSPGLFVILNKYKSYVNSCKYNVNAV